MAKSISKEYKFGGLLKFALPSVIMMMFMSLYVIVDGIFVSNFVPEKNNALAAINIIYPSITMLFSIAVLIGTGGTALVSKQMGEGNMEKANKTFSLLVITALLISSIYIGVISIFADPIVKMLGANDVTAPLCKEYMILLAFAPFICLQGIYQSFFVTAGKANLGLICIVAAGVLNVFFDWLFIVVLNFGLTGAALATGIGYTVPSIVGTIFFFTNKNGLRFTSPSVKGENTSLLLKTALNGSSEMAISISTSIVTILFNNLIMSLEAEGTIPSGVNAIAAITIVMYAQFLFSSFFLGYSMGIAPIIGYQYGADNHSYLKKTFSSSIIFVFICSLIMTGLSILCASHITSIFAGDNQQVYELGVRAMRLFSICYLFIGVNIVSSGLFTAVSDGITSGIISLLRTGVFAVSSIFLLEHFLKLDGLWLALPLAEFITTIMVLTIFLVKTKRKTLFPKHKKGDILPVPCERNA